VTLPPTRRVVLGSLGLMIVGAGAGCSAEASPLGPGRVLPPTAGDLDTFLSECIRCFRCGEVCTAGCIEFHPFWAGPRLAGTPYLVPRVAGCNTCMRCTSVCPTDALTATETDEESVLAAVDMGLAWVDEGLCLSHQGRVCGVCHDACPYPGSAIQLEGSAKPVVQEDCVGCGRCEERCPQVPSAIRVFREEPGPRWKGPRS